LTIKSPLLSFIQYDFRMETVTWRSKQQTETWLTRKLMKGENEGGKEPDANDKVELRLLGSTFQFCGNIWKSRRKENPSWGAGKAEKHRLGQQLVKI